jgi:predicted ester cyclase
MPDAATIQREMFEAVERRDFERLRELIHPDYTYIGGDGVERAGAEAAVAVAEYYTTAFPDLSFEVRAGHAPSDDVAILELIARGTHTGPLGDVPPTGRSGEVVACNVGEVRDGRIIREREYFDTFAIMSQLGLADAPAPGAEVSSPG